MWFGDQIIDYPPSGSHFGLVVRPLGAGDSGSLVVTGSMGITAPVTVMQGTNPWNISGSSWTPTVTGRIEVQTAVKGDDGITKLQMTLDSILDELQAIREQLEDINS